MVIFQRSKGSPKLARETKKTSNPLTFSRQLASLFLCRQFAGKPTWRYEDGPFEMVAK
jgi:hypothetical protein